jgi:CelD/BcsL family acetyltransferase involved in cellulose biosynthesis
MNDATVTVIDDISGLDSIRNQWNGLVETIENSTPFITHTWIRQWWINFNEGNPLYTLCVWRNGILIGVLPLQKTVCKVLRIFKLSCLQSLVNGQCSMSNLICSADNRMSVLAAIKSHLIENRPVWDLMMVAFIPLDENGFGQCKAVFQKPQFAVFVEPEGMGFTSYFLELKGDFESYFNRLNKNFRNNRRNINNRLARSGTFSFEVTKTFDAASVDRFIELEGSTWKNEAGTSINLLRGARSFYRAVAKEFAENGHFLLATARKDGVEIASIYGLLFHSTFYFLKIGINGRDPGLKKISPGQVVLYNLIKYCFDQKIAAFDFWGSCYFYESHWTKDVHQKKTVMVFNRSSSYVKVCVVLKEIIGGIKKRVKVRRRS